ncbi:MAG: transcription antitermination factor NusB [Ilumatobacteraceae bacterium]
MSGQRRPGAPRSGGQRQGGSRPSPSNARGVAYHCLCRIDQDGAYANLVTAAQLEHSRLDDRDRRFVTELVHGTTRMRRACDALIDRFISSEPEPEIRTLLRLGAYQLYFMGVSAHAAVGETVELAPRRASGFVNAVLRRVSSTPMTWPSDGVRLSYPDWIVDRLSAEMGDDAIAALTAMNEAPSATERDDGYRQDLGSQWVAAAVPATDGDRVLDVCAAPGGKATAIASRGAVVVAADLQANRVGLIADNARRYGDGRVLPIVADGTAAPFPPGSFQHVLIDAPCSGLGTLRRRPDARWRIAAADVDTLADLQQRLLTSSAPLVAPGGTLTYSVCTLLAAESIDHPMPDGFEIDDRRPDGDWRPFGRGWRVLPQDAGTDGMILLRYRRPA